MGTLFSSNRKILEYSSVINRKRGGFKKDRYGVENDKIQKEKGRLGKVCGKRRACLTV